ncbi:hypothetical protein FB381_2907 [Nocardioides albertanoniae]|uniref:DUF3806 domain-containing protein n=1 Tax=Nocardioides albertanoniae TaxID=1175486 RepID=A0A543A953_9ACTN|nr:hypothetical protein [Nocardioides albertanoniae]TQL69006.1 hypothetical protein FB381_2907 [Nocardioides albertanoniae]
MTAPTDDPARHPDLLTWLEERRAAHPAWARSTGSGDELDLTPSSLDALDRLVRDFADAPGVISEARTSPFLQGALWYLGEVFCRHAGMTWKYQPDPILGPVPLFGLDTLPGLDSPCVSLPEDEPERGLYPLNLLRRILIDEDEMGEPMFTTLPWIFEDPYEDDD